MLKKALIFLFYIFIFLIIPPAFYFLQSQPISLSQEKVEYNLPYPGILPDHPLYPIKNIRDKILELTTRDSIKKAELYLLFSDKRVAMAANLTKNGKEKSAAATFTEAEEYFSKIPQLIENSKQQGVSASSEFIQRLRLSNFKHKEVGTSLLNDLSQGLSGEINKALNLNKQLKKKLEKL